MQYAPSSSYSGLIGCGKIAGYYFNGIYFDQNTVVEIVILYMYVVEIVILYMFVILGKFILNTLSHRH